jgi:hypothetical protein
MDDLAAGQDYTDGGEDYSDAAAAAANVTTGKAAATGGKAAATAGKAAGGKAGGGKEAAHDEDRIVNGYSVDGRPWYVAFQVNDLFFNNGEINYAFLAVYVQLSVFLTSRHTHRQQMCLDNLRDNKNTFQRCM